MTRLTTFTTLLLMAVVASLALAQLPQVPTQPVEPESVTLHVRGHVCHVWKPSRKRLPEREWCE